MRQLSFRSFLARYVRQLSKGDANSICILEQEATSNNPRLKAPLLMFALYSGNGDILLNAAYRNKEYCLLKLLSSPSFPRFRSQSSIQ